MATSERILTTLPRAAGPQQITTARLAAPSSAAAWPLAFLDFATAFIGLTLIGLVIHAGLLSGPRLPPAARCALGLMLTTLFAFSGAYPRRRTPLDIANTEGLVRGTFCAMALLAIASLGLRVPFSSTAIPSAAAILLLLVMQREVVARLLRRERLDDSSLEDYDAYCDTASDDLGSGYALKRCLDVAGAAILLVLVLPVGLAVALLIKLDSRGPVLIRQRRIGRLGAPFLMWKFRSMHAGVARYERSPISDNDPRMTRLGRVLRRLSIDELPQFVNVLSGDMSLVGPRPEMAFIVKEYTAYERQRLNALPGITGLWQISPARAMPIHHNVGYDLFYIANRSLFLDVAILLRTLTAVVRGIGAR